MESSDTKEIARHLGREIQGEVLSTQFDLGRYATDASCYQIMPLCVVVPKNITDLETTLSICRNLDVPVMARGGGTSQSGQTVNRAVVLDLSKYLNHLIPIKGEKIVAGSQNGPTIRPGVKINQDLVLEIQESQTIRVSRRI